MKLAVITRAKAVLTRTRRAYRRYQAKHRYYVSVHRRVLLSAQISELKSELSVLLAAERAAREEEADSKCHLRSFN